MQMHINDQVFHTNHDNRYGYGQISQARNGRKGHLRCRGQMEPFSLDQASGGRNTKERKARIGTFNTSSDISSEQIKPPRG